jgi:hypothetical protein
MASDTTGPLTDPAIADADRRVERAKASLRSRFEEIERRFVGVRDRLDVPEHIRRHPLPAVGIALALGALAGRGGTRRAAIDAPGERSLGGTAFALAATLALRIVRELAIAQLGITAKRYLEHSD